MLVAAPDNWVAARGKKIKVKGSNLCSSCQVTLTASDGAPSPRVLEFVVKGSDRAVIKVMGLPQSLLGKQVLAAVACNGRRSAPVVVASVGTAATR